MNILKPNDQTRLPLAHKLFIFGLAIALIVGGTSVGNAAEKSASMIQLPAQIKV